jgi:hypothetical protein
LTFRMFSSPWHKDAEPPESAEAAERGAPRIDSAATAFGSNDSRTAPAAFEQRVERHVAANTRWEIFRIGLPQGPDARGAVLAAYFAVRTGPALRFLFDITLDRPDIVRHLPVAREPRKAPVILSPEEVARMLEAAPGVKYKAALSMAYCAGPVAARSSSPRLHVFAKNAFQQAQGRSALGCRTDNFAPALPIRSFASTLTAREASNYFRHAGYA